MATPTRLKPRSTFQDCYCQCPLSHVEPLLTHTSMGDPPTLAGRSHSVSYGVTAPFPWAWHIQDFVSALHRYSLCFPSPVEVLLLNTTGLQSQIPCGVPVLLADSQAVKPDMGLKTFTTVGELLWYYCSPICGLPTQWVWNLILLILLIMGLLPSHCSIYFVFGHRVSFFFFWWFQHPLLMVGQELIVIFVFWVSISVLHWHYRIAQSCPTLCNSLDSSPPGSSVGFFREEYWSGLSFPPLGDLPHPGIKPTPLVSPALQADFFTTEPSGTPLFLF